MQSLHHDNTANTRVWGANGRRVEAIFESSDVEHSSGGLGDEAEGTALFLPVMRQIFAQSQQLGRRLFKKENTFRDTVNYQLRHRVGRQ
jgi:hypothetical protein